MPREWHALEALSHLARVTAFQGDFAVALVLYQETLALAKEMGDKLITCFVLEGLADIAVSQGESIWAARLWGAAKALRDATGAPLYPVYRADYERSIAAARAQVGEQIFAAAWAEGRTMRGSCNAVYEISTTLP
jgi:hypothetical protein